MSLQRFPLDERPQGVYKHLVVLTAAQMATAEDNGPSLLEEATMVVEEKMLDRIQALIAKANAHGVTEHESDALMAKAYELMERYRIDDAMLAARASVKFKPLHKLFLVEGSFAKGRRQLAFSIAKGMGLAAVSIRKYDPYAGKFQHYMDVFGFESDLEVYQLLFTSLMLQGHSECNRLKGYDAGHTRSIRSGFWFGYAHKIAWRLIDARQAESKKSTGTELVLVGRKAEIDRLRDEVYPSLRSEKVTKVNAHGYAAGESAGSRANLHNRKAAGVNSRASIGALWISLLPMSTVRCLN